LVLTQFVGPLGAALWFAGGRQVTPRLRAFAASCLIAGIGILALRGMLWWCDWWSFPRIFRHAPWPMDMVQAAGQLAHDVTGPMWASIGGFIVLFALGILGAASLSWRLMRGATEDREAWRRASWFAGLSLVSTVALPILAVYWREPQHGRYLLPCLLLPGWWFTAVAFASGKTAVAAVRASRSRGMILGVLVVGWGFAGCLAVAQIDFRRWAWPYPAAVKELDALLTGESRGRGLADFWNAHYLTTVSRGGIRLNQLRADGQVQFWGNNAFHHFDLDSSKRLVRPTYRFIVVNGLDEGALAAKFGAPDRTTLIAGYRLWLYDAKRAEDLSRRVEDEVRMFLAGRPGTERILPGGGGEDEVSR
jgi:hypothetical protein